MMDKKSWAILEKIFKKNSYAIPWLPKDALAIMNEFFEELLKEGISLDSTTLEGLNKLIKENLTKKDFPFKINNN